MKLLMKPFFASVLWTLSTLNFAIIQAVVNGVKWNKHLGDFVPISGLSSYEVERQRIVLQSQQKESLNFNGQPLNITYFEDFGFLHFHDNDTRATGVFGDIYTVLSKFLNFTLVLSNSKDMRLGVLFPNGSYSGIVEYARVNQTDIIPKMPVYVTGLNAVTFAPVLWMNSQKIFALGHWKRNYAWMFTLFPKEVWGLVGLSILTISLISLLSQRILIRHRGLKLRSRSYPDHLFYVYSTLCNQANENDSVTNRSKILALTISFFSLLTLNCYNSHLINSMTKEIFDAPFTDLTTLFENTKFHIAVLRGSVAHSCFTSIYTDEIFKRISRAKRVKILSNIEELYRQVCFNSDKYVLLDADDDMQARKDTLCTLIPVGPAHYKLPIASGISKRVKKKRSIDIGFMKLREYGIIDKIKQRYMELPKREIGYRQIDDLAIGMDRVYLIFGLLFLGIFVSMVICVAEKAHFTFKKRRTMKNSIRRLPTTIKQPLFVRSVYTQKCN